jgi:antibiotic biosynthesis monooxygenase (ABM) superfamily enzyme
MTFTYSGRELVKPLRRLLVHSHSESARLRFDLNAYAHDNENDFIRWAQSSDTTTTAERNGRARLYLRSVERVREVELWLYEVKRKPRATWTLDLEGLAKLYPVEIAPETTAGELLKEGKGWL